MTHSVEEIWTQIRALPPAEQQTLLVRLLAECYNVTSQEQWEQFITESYGTLADDPIQRESEGEFEERESIL